MARRSTDQAYRELLLAEYHNDEAAETLIMGKGKQPRRIILETSSPLKKCWCVDLHPMEKGVHGFQKLSKQAENLASNIWINLTTGQSVRKAAWGKVSLGAKVLSKGGFETLFKHTFQVETHEKLLKTYACYLSTSSGPVAGTLYISTLKIAFCSDRPLSFTFPSGRKDWAYYRVAIPVVKVKAVNPSANRYNQVEKYIQVLTEDDYEFWFMGFIKYHKALNNLQAFLL